MKKFCSLVFVAALIFACAISVQAQAGAALNSADEVTVGQTVELVLSVSDCPDVTTASVAVTYAEGFAFVSGTWLQRGIITHYDTNTNMGAVAGLNKPDINGDLFRLVLRAVTPSADAQAVSIMVTGKNGTEDILRTTVSKEIFVRCENHTYGQWIINDNSHQQVCSVCGLVNSQPHQWSVEVDIPAGCVCEGTQWYTCTQCDFSVMENIPATGHSYVEGICQRCGAEDPDYVLSGNLNGDEKIDNQDVEYLLWYTLFPEEYPLNSDADYDGDGRVDNQDVEYLLWHTLFPEEHPIG